MKFRNASLLICVSLAVSLPSVSAAPAPSTETQSKIIGDAPAYDPALRAAAEKQKAEEGILEDEIVVMPEMTVQEKSVRRLEEESLFKRGAWDKELRKREQSELDRYFLNRYTLKLGSGPVSIGIAGAQSGADRAREAYAARKNQEFKDRAKNFSDVLKTTDDKEAEDLKTLMLDNARSSQPVETTARPSNWR